MAEELNWSSSYSWIEKEKSHKAGSQQRIVNWIYYDTRKAAIQATHFQSMEKIRHLDRDMKRLSHQVARLTLDEPLTPLDELLKLEHQRDELQRKGEGEGFVDEDRKVLREAAFKSITKQDKGIDQGVMEKLGALEKEPEAVGAAVSLPEEREEAATLIQVANGITSNVTEAQGIQKNEAVPEAGAEECRWVPGRTLRPRKKKATPK